MAKSLNSRLYKNWMFENEEVEGKKIKGKIFLRYKNYFGVQNILGIRFLGLKILRWESISFRVNLFQL